MQIMFNVILPIIEVDFYVYRYPYLYNLQFQEWPDKCRIHVFMYFYAIYHVALIHRAFTLGTCMHLTYVLFAKNVNYSLRQVWNLYLLLDMY